MRKPWSTEKTMESGFVEDLRISAERTFLQLQRRLVNPSGICRLLVPHFIR